MKFRAYAIHHTIYVGMSRPRYLLCVAIQKDRFDNMDCRELREIWDVVKV